LDFDGAPDLGRPAYHRVAAQREHRPYDAERADDDHHPHRMFGSAARHGFEPTVDAGSVENGADQP
jgi:hypothetical protein